MGTTVKTIFLLRHAKSSWKDDGLPDFERPLSKRGHRAAAALALHLTQLAIAPAQILCSPAVRTRETLEALEGSFAAPVPVRFEKGIYMAEAPSLLRRLRRLSDALPSVMVIGHNPGLERLALLLIESGDLQSRAGLSSKFPTGALAVLSAGVDAWRTLAPATCHLEMFVRPKDLVGA